MPAAHSFRHRGSIRGPVVAALAIAGLLLIGLSSAALWRRGAMARNVAAQAKDWLLQRNVKPLREDTQTLVAARRATSVPTLEHPLLGQSAPDFQLSDHTGRTHSLREHLDRGPVLVVFYYGYYCNHCVSQLFALHDDLVHFQTLGGQVLAISPDSTQETREKFARFGAFDFPVLADPYNAVAAAYSVYTPRTSKHAERLLHGTFIIDRAGIVRWCHYGPAPFTDNGTLLVELSKCL
jgi:peroxiredoxin